MAFIGNPAETLSSPVKFSPQRQGNLHIKNDIDDIHKVCTTEIFTRKFVSRNYFHEYKASIWVLFPVEQWTFLNQDVVFINGYCEFSAQLEHALREL
jgi:hypothetical protein